MSSDAPFQMPEDIAGISNDDLAVLRQQAETEFAALYEGGGATAESLARATELADAIEAISGEEGNRRQAAEEAAAALDAQRQRVDAIRAQSQPQDEGDEDDPDGGDDDSEGEAPAEQAAQEPALVADATPPPAKRKTTDVRDVIKAGPSLNARFADAAKRAPNPQVPERAADGLVIVAATPTAGLPIGSRIDTLDRLVRTMANYAKGTAISNGAPNWVPLATVQSKFDNILSERMSPADVEAKIRAMTRPEVLTAAGGWCAPSEVRYDFFNIACEDGLVDMPTFGVERGGIRWPTSPSLADVFSGAFTNETNPWLWTEGDDISAVTGSVAKPCVRVPCPDFNEARLECYGICLTAGNLTDSAYPEATRNYLALLMSAHARAMNTRYISQMVTGSTNVGAIGTAGSGTTAPLLGSIELAAIDYRTRYGMCREDILEVILPVWALGAIRSDLAKRTGVDLLAVSNSMIADWFDLRGVRVQLVTDWQVRASGFPGFSSALTAWPTTLEFLIYAAGTFVRGNGMSLDLGVVRDSTLNADNDHTAAWTEECHLIARVGHESRRYAVAICTDGTTGANDLTACGV